MASIAGFDIWIAPSHYGDRSKLRIVPAFGGTGRWNNAARACSWQSVAKLRILTARGLPLRRRGICVAAGRRNLPYLLGHTGLVSL
jgi:hypothetical protein